MLYGYSFVVYIKADDIYKHIAEDVETRFDTSNYELDRPFPKEKYKKVKGLIKDELGGKIMTKIVGLRAKTKQKLNLSFLFMAHFFVPFAFSSSLPPSIKMAVVQMKKQKAQKSVP